MRAASLISTVSWHCYAWIARCREDFVGRAGWRGVWRLAICFSLVSGLGACGSAPRVARYRFTVEVDDNGRVVAGSAVQEEHCVFNDGLLKGMGNALNCGVKGEAVVVDLGSKGALFVVLTGDSTRPRISGNAWGNFVYAHRSFYQQIGGMNVAVFDEIAGQTKPVEIEAVNMPLMVRFTDPDDPRTARRVDPEHLDASFGAGVSFRRATVEITADPLTTGIEKRLPWLTAPHTLAGIVQNPGKRSVEESSTALRPLLYDDFWSNMQ